MPPRAPIHTTCQPRGARLLGDREAREDVAAGAARHDEERPAHACSPPRKLAVLPVDAQQDGERDEVDHAGREPP